MNQIPRRIILNGTEILNLDRTSAQPIDVANGRTYFDITGTLVEGTDELTNSTMGVLEIIENGVYTPTTEGADLAGWNYIDVKVPISEVEEISLYDGTVIIEKAGVRGLRRFKDILTPDENASYDGENSEELLANYGINITPIIKDGVAVSKISAFIKYTPEYSSGGENDGVIVARMVADDGTTIVRGVSYPGVLEMLGTNTIDVLSTANNTVDEWLLANTEGVSV